MFLTCNGIDRLLIAVCLGSFLWLLKNALYLKLEADLHYRQLFDRIQNSVGYLNGICILDKGASDHPAGASDKPTVTFLRYYDNDTKQKWYECMIKTTPKMTTTEETEKTEEVKVKNIWMDVIKMNKETVPIWIVRRLEKEYLRLMKTPIKPGNADELLQDDEALLEKAAKMFTSITGKEKFDQFNEIERAQLEKYDLSKPELDFLFKRRSGEEETSLKTISHDQFFNWAVRAHKNSWGLERTLRSSKLALIKLNRLLSTFLLAVVLIIYLILTNIVTTAQLALLFAPFLAASFVFENSLKNMFHGLIFVFAMHPFDVGDRVVIDGAQLRVKELNILTSVFFKYDTGSNVIYPNSKLATMRIVNLDITPDQSDELNFVVSADTPPEDVKDLELKIQKWLDDDKKYSPGTKVVKCTESSFSNKEPLKMTVHFKYLVSYLTVDKKAEHKSAILSHIMKFRKEMEGNKKEYPHEHEPYYIEFTLEKAKLEQIKDIKRKIMSCLVVKGHYPESKVVIAALDSKRMTMALYIRKTIYKEKKNEEEKSDETETNTHHDPKSEDMPMEEESKYFAELLDKLKEVQHYAMLVKVEKHGRVVYEQGENWGKLRSGFRGELEGNRRNGGLEESTLPSIDEDSFKGKCCRCF